MIEPKMQKIDSKLVMGLFGNICPPIRNHAANFF